MVVVEDVDSRILPILPPWPILRSESDCECYDARERDSSSALSPLPTISTVVTSATSEITHSAPLHPLSKIPLWVRAS